jgi:hypothetical protein
MDLIVFTSTLLAAWGVLCVLGGERERKRIDLAVALAKAEAEKAAVESKPSH